MSCKLNFLSLSVVLLMNFFVCSRGVRQELPNPLYNPDYPETGVAPSDPQSPSNLPPEDPNFSPKEYCPPKLLFPEARGRAKHKGRVAARVGSDDEAGGLHLPETPKPAKKKDRVEVQVVKRQKEPVRSQWDTSDEEGPEPVPTSTPPPLAHRKPITRAQATTRAQQVPIRTTETLRTRPHTRSQTTKEAPRDGPAKRAIRASASRH